MQRKTHIHNVPAAHLSDCALLRLWQIIGDKKKGIQPIIPISRTSWLNGVKSGKYPAPINLSERSKAWKASDISALIDRMGGAL